MNFPKTPRARAFSSEAAAGTSLKGVTVEDDKPEFPKTIAQWKAKPDDPNGKPMTVDEYIAQIRAEHEAMLKDLFAQVQAWAEFVGSGGQKH